MDYSYYNIAGNREDLELEKLFKRFKSVKEYQFTQGNICFDAIVNNNTLVEIKVRSVNDYVFNNYVIKEGILLENSKYESLLKAKDTYNMSKILYINIFKEQNQILIYNLDQIDINITEKKCNQQTYAHNDTKITKKLILLDYNKALNLKYNT